jgi:hypothetical protein
MAATSFALAVRFRLSLSQPQRNKTAASASYQSTTHEMWNWKCEKFVEIESKIERYRRLSSGLTDEATLDGIRKLIEQMKAQKAALHPEQPK